MGRLILSLILGFVVRGYTAHCPNQTNVPEREILCYSSSNDSQQIQGFESICRCTILVHRGHDLQHLDISDIRRIRDSVKKVNPSALFALSVSDSKGLLSSSRQTSNSAIANISAIINEIDGVELNITAKSKHHLVDFIHDLKEETIAKSSDLKILLALPTKHEQLAKKFDLRNLTRYVDMFTISTHYLTDDGERFRTFHPSRLMGPYDLSNTDSLIDVVHGLGVDKEKIVISLPSSGYQFTLLDQTSNAPGAPTLHERPLSIDRKKICDTIQSGEWLIERERDLTAPYAFNNITWIAFEDEISTKIKGKYVLLRDLAGLAIDEIDNDSGTNCGSSITEEIYRSFTDNTRKPRAAILHSLEEDIHHPEPLYPSNVKTSTYRISRVVDSAGESHSIRENTETEFVCGRQGYFVHPKSCNRFYRCVKFNQEVEDYNVFEFHCPPGLEFDEGTEVCVWPGSLSKGSACPGSSEIAPSLPKRFSCPGGGYYADPDNCRRFFACINLGDDAEMKPYEFRCPYGLVFDEEKLMCEWPWLVANCPGDKTETAFDFVRREYDQSTKGSFNRTLQIGSDQPDRSQHQSAGHSSKGQSVPVLTPLDNKQKISNPQLMKNSTLKPEVEDEQAGRVSSDKLTPSESHIQASGSILTRVDSPNKTPGSFQVAQIDGALPTGPVIPNVVLGSASQDMNPGIVGMSATGNEYHINQAGRPGVTAQGNFPYRSNTFGTSVSSTWGGTTAQGRTPGQYSTGGIGKIGPEINKHPVVSNRFGPGVGADGIPNGWSPTGSPTRFPVQHPATAEYATVSSVTQFGMRNAFSTGANGNKLPANYSIASPVGVDGNQFFTNHAGGNTLYKNNPFLSSTSLTNGNTYHTNQAGYPKETPLSQSDVDGYKTNEYYDNGGRSTIRYNNGLYTHKYPENDVKTGKIPLSGSPVEFPNDKFGTLDFRSGFRNGGPLVASNLRPITKPNQFGTNLFGQGPGKVPSSSMPTQSIFNTSLPPLVNPGVQFGTNETSSKDRMEQPATPFNIPADNNLTTEPFEPAIVNTFSSGSISAQPAKTFSASSTVTPINCTRISTSSSLPTLQSSLGNEADDSETGNASTMNEQNSDKQSTGVNNTSSRKTFNVNNENDQFNGIPASTTRSKQQSGYDRSKQGTNYNFRPTFNINDRRDQFHRIPSSTSFSTESNYDNGPQINNAGSRARLHLDGADDQHNGIPSSTTAQEHQSTEDGPVRINNGGSRKILNPTATGQFHRTIPSNPSPENQNNYDGPARSRSGGSGETFRPTNRNDHFNRPLSAASPIQKVISGQPAEVDGAGSRSTFNLNNANDQSSRRPSSTSSPKPKDDYDQPNQGISGSRNTFNLNAPHDQSRRGPSTSFPIQRNDYDQSNPQSNAGTRNISTLNNAGNQSNRRPPSPSFSKHQNSDQSTYGSAPGGRDRFNGYNTKDQSNRRPSPAAFPKPLSDDADDNDQDDEANDYHDPQVDDGGSRNTSNPNIATDQSHRQSSSPSFPNQQRDQSIHVTNTGSINTFHPNNANGYTNRGQSSASFPKQHYDRDQSTNINNAGSRNRFNLNRTNDQSNRGPSPSSSPKEQTGYDQSTNISNTASRNRFNLNNANDQSNRGPSSTSLPDQQNHYDQSVQPNRAGFKNTINQFNRTPPSTSFSKAQDNYGQSKHVDNAVSRNTFNVNNAHDQSRGRPSLVSFPKPPKDYGPSNQTDNAASRNTFNLPNANDQSSGRRSSTLSPKQQTNYGQATQIKNAASGTSFGEKIWNQDIGRTVRPATSKSRAGKPLDNVEKHSFTTEQPSVTTYNGGYPDSLTMQSFETRKMSSERRVVIKYSDLRPILLDKLEAECTCKSEPLVGFRKKKQLLIDSSKGTINLADYDESQVYVDLESDEELRERVRLHDRTRKSRNSDAEMDDYYEIDESEERNSSESEMGEGTLECARPGLFRHPEICNKFYVCQWNHEEDKFDLLVSDCPVHLTFDHKAQACNLPSQGTTCHNQ